MKLTNWDATNKEWAIERVAEGQVDFEQKDRLDRTIGAGFYIEKQIYVVDETMSYENNLVRNPCLAGGAGTYFSATIFNTRNRERYQATTSTLCASMDAAHRYCAAYVAKKRKDAVKKAGK